MNFASDNAYGVAPQIIDAVDRRQSWRRRLLWRRRLSARVARRFCEVFEREVDVLLVPSGTAANALGLAALTPPFGSIFCHAQSHIQLEECGAAEFFADGAKLVPIAGAAGRIVPADLDLAIARLPGHRSDLRPSAVSLTNATECGTLYRPGEIAALAEVARRHGLGIHVDGARIANAVAALGVTPADLTWRVGVDVLSFGATKNGAICADAVVVFDRARLDGLAERRKRGGHLLSKMRFLAAQLEPYLEGGLWLDLAGRANASARRLSQGLTAIPGIRLPWPCEANEVFAVMPAALADALRSQGAVFYPWTTAGLSAVEMPDETQVFVRLVTSFATETDDIDRLLVRARALSGAPASS